MNKAIYFLQIVMKNLDKDKKKSIKPDPIAAAEKWGKLQVDMLKKTTELEALDKSMQETLVAMSVSLKKLNEALEKDNPQEASIMHKLLQK